MKASVFIEPHERYEAIETYRDKLNFDQIHQIKTAPDGVAMMLEYDGVGSKLTIFHEGMEFGVNLSRRGFLLSGASVAALTAAESATANRLLLHAYVEPWEPVSGLGDSLIAMLDADDVDLMVNDGGNLISSWSTRTGGITVTASGSARGTWSTTGFNGTNAAIDTDGVANCYTTLSLGAIPTGGNPSEVWVLAHQKSATPGTSQVAMQYGGAAANVAVRRVLKGSVGIKAQIYADTAVATDNLHDWTGPALVRGVWSGSAENGWFNGVPFITNPTAIDPLATGTTRLRIGAATAGSPTLFGQFGFNKIAFTKPLNLLQQYQLEGWMLWNVGLQALLPATHRFRWARPEKEKNSQ